VLDRGEWSASRFSYFTVVENTIALCKFYLLASWLCAPGLACPITFTKEEGERSEDNSQIPTNRLRSAPARLVTTSWQEQLTTTVCRSNKTQSDFFFPPNLHSKPNGMAALRPQNREEQLPLSSRPPEWHLLPLYTYGQLTSRSCVLGVLQTRAPEGHCHLSLKNFSTYLQKSV
jgi:hypothetical protein